MRLLHLVMILVTINSICLSKVVYDIFLTVTKSSNSNHGSYLMLFYAIQI